MIVPTEAEMFQSGPRWSTTNLHCHPSCRAASMANKKYYMVNIALYQLNMCLFALNDRLSVLSANLVISSHNYGCNIYNLEKQRISLNLFSWFICANNYYLYYMCSFSSSSSAAVKKLRAILEKFTGLIHNAGKKKICCLPPSPSLRAFVIKARHKCFKASTGGLPWLQSHPVGLAIYWGFPFSFSGEMKMHVAKLSEPSFHDFKARQNPRELWDLCQMAMCCIPQALLTFTICLSDLSNKETQAAAFWK